MPTMANKVCCGLVQHYIYSTILVVGTLLMGTLKRAVMSPTFVDDGDAVEEKHIRKGKEMHSDDMTDEEVR